MRDNDPGIPGLRDFIAIGTGGFSTVYRAFEEDANRQVAVKILAAFGDSARRRFDRERRTMGQTTGHPNIVSLFRSGYIESDQRPYLVMEYLSGGSAQDLIDAAGPLGVSQAIDIVLPIADALSFAHGQGIVHKDIKPANILISSTGVPKLADFGIAGIRGGTDTSQMAFSLSYAAPESFLTSRIGDPRDALSDLYSLAATLYTLVGGSPPFEDDNHAALMLAIINDEPPESSHPRLQQFFAIALEKDPARRFQSAGEFAEQLRLVRGDSTEENVLSSRHPVAHTAALGATGSTWAHQVGPLLELAASSKVVGSPTHVAGRIDEDRRRRTARRTSLLLGTSLLLVLLASILIVSETAATSVAPLFWVGVLTVLTFAAAAGGTVLAGDRLRGRFASQIERDANRLSVEARSAYLMAMRETRAIPRPERTRRVGSNGRG